VSKKDDDIKAQLAYWQELAELVGWEVMGWSFKNTASYVTGENQTLQMTGRQRDDLVAAITRQAIIK
jgi:hypothetical protein